MSCITFFFIINLFRSSNFAYERFWKYVNIGNRRWKFSFPHIKQKNKYCTKKKKRKLISPFQFPILFSLSPLPILAFENIRCRKCLSSNFLKSYHFKANINNKNKIKTISGSEKLHSSEKNTQQRWKRIRPIVTFTTIHQVFPLRFTAQQADILEYYSQVCITIKMIRVISASFLFSQRVFFSPTQFKKKFRI